MSKLKAILIDDEKSSLQSLTFELNAYCPEVEVIATCKDPLEGLQEIRKSEFDILFLDIEMPGMNGFELLQQLAEIDFNIIFVTAYDQFAIKAFEFNALDYLLKPVRKEKLIQAMQRVRDQQQLKLDKLGLEALMQNIRVQTTTGIEQIALPTSDGFSMVHVNDITYLQADSNYTWVFLANKKKYLIAKTLKEMEGMLEFPQFFRAHKSYLANLNHVEKYVRGQGGYLVMRDATQVPVARAQKAELMKFLKV
ncbi:MAG TPA: LytTR family DNA-binding domain-containing protein [Saprospiraceae bacterium]|nr:LytTR family DNA-binding domain-containing protein [Saprospiraceae bacterium]